MDTTRLADEIQGLLTSIGRAFFFADYLPALLFVSLHQYVLLPAIGWSGTLLPGVPEVPFLSGELLTTLLLPLFLAMLLVSLNTYITKFFEGLLPWQRKYVLSRWQHANEQKCQQLYGKLHELKQNHRSLLEQAAEAGSGAEPDGSLDDSLTKAEQEIQQAFENIEKSQPTQTLPFRPKYVRPTALGNAFAVFEEYPLDRYGMVSVVLWPRLRQVVDGKLLSAVDNLKMFLDFQLNLSALALIFAVEAAGIGVVKREIGWWIAAALAILVARLAYSAGVRVTRTMGVVVSTCFDLFREELLEQFGLPRPAKFFEEYKTWLRLSAFLRRGAILHWPGDL